MMSVKAVRILTVFLWLGSLSSSENTTARYQLEFQLIRFENPYGVGSDGLPCDPLTHGCDTRIYAYLDISKASEAWPGSREILPDDRIFEANDPARTSFDIHKNIVVHLCEPALEEVLAVRVRVTDEDGIYRGTDDLIGEYTCRFNTTAAPTSEESRWSESRSCEPVEQQSMTWITFRTRLFSIQGYCSVPKNATVQT